jgi:hypothetical protein
VTAPNSILDRPPPARPAWTRCLETAARAGRRLGFGRLSRFSRLILIHLVLLAVACALLLPMSRQMLFWGFDGAYFKTQIRQQQEWMPPSLNFGNTPFQGLGNIFFSSNFRLLPATGISRLLNNGRVSPKTIYTIIACELFLAVVLSARSFRAGARASLLAGWLAAMTIMPFVDPPPMYYGISWLAPTGVEAISLQILGLSLFARLGCGGARRDAARASAVTLILFWTLCAAPVTYVITMPTILVVACSRWVWADVGRERRIKLGFAVVVLFAALPTAIPFLAGMLVYSVPSLLGDELLNDKVTLTNVSVLFQREQGWLGAILVVVSTLCSMRLLFSRRRQRRALAAATLTMTTLIVGGGMILTFVFTQYDGPVMLYFEFAVWPLYFTTAAIGLYASGVKLSRNLRPFTRYFRELTVQASRIAKHHFPAWLDVRRLTPSMQGTSALLLLPLGVAVWMYPGAELPDQMMWRFPPASNPIIEELRREAALKRGGAFRGSVATFTGYAGKPPGVSWFDQHSFDAHVHRAVGNDFRALGLWHFDIPTLFEYNQLITPPFHLMTTRRLSRPADRQIRNIVTLTKIDCRYLASIGVRFVIADYDEPLQQGAKLRLAVPVAGGEDIRLFEIPHPNLGDYSPTRIVQVDNAAEALMHCDSDSFDYRRDVLLHEPLAGPLVPAERSRVTLDRQGMRVTARSPGKSLLLLPLQFSRCLEVHDLRGGAQGVRLVRANVMQAALVFSGEIYVDICFRYGVFANPYGRLADYAEAKRLGIESRAFAADMLALRESADHQKTVSPPEEATSDSAAAAPPSHTTRRNDSSAVR